MSNKDDHYAYGPEWAGLEGVMRLQAVKRWHMIDTTRSQTLAEHSANVALLSMYIAKTAPNMFFGGCEYITTAALLHDIAEVFMGDIPTHSKRWLNRRELDKAEFAITPSILIYPNITEHQKALIKFCDLSDGIRFIRIHGVDLTANHAMAGLQKQLQLLIDVKAVLWPKYVLDHVLNIIHFYAYETRIDTTAIDIRQNEESLDNDMA